MPEPKRHPEELRERAVRMVFEIREQTGLDKGAMARVARRLGFKPEVLQNWMNEAEVSPPSGPGTSTGDRQRG